MQEEPKLSEVLEAIKSQQASTERRFDEADKRFEETLGLIKANQADTDKHFDEMLSAVKSGFDSVDARFVGLEGRFDGLEKRVTKIEATMVTKDYLDEKLSRVGGKLNVLVNILLGKSVITEDNKRSIHA